MFIEQTKRRKDISDLVAQEQFEKLSVLGISCLQGVPDIDCAAYVLSNLGAVANHRSVHVLHTAKRFENPMCGIVLYRFLDERIIQNNGLFDGKRVTSKWGVQAPVVVHEIADVPLEFGTVVEFIAIDSELNYRLQEVMYGGGEI